MFSFPGSIRGSLEDRIEVLENSSFITALEDRVTKLENFSLTTAKKDPIAVAKTNVSIQSLVDRINLLENDNSTIDERSNTW